MVMVSATGMPPMLAVTPVVVVPLILFDFEKSDKYIPVGLSVSLTVTTQSNKHG